jgi:S-formylglutathione hydrolase FrmB
VLGTIENHEVRCPRLAGFPGMSENRPLLAYIPHGVDAGNPAVATLYCLAPWTSAGRAQFAWKPFRESLPDRIDRLMASGMPPVVVVAPDLYCETFGGSQYVDSEALGPHATVLVEDMIPFVEANLPVKPGKDRRIFFGRSSGGYGAIRLAMDFPEHVGAIASHSGDMGFEIMFGSDLVTLPKTLARYEGRVEDYLKDLRDQPKISGGDMHALMLLGMAATYSPNKSVALGYDLPIDLYSGKLNEDVLRRWAEHDPVTVSDDKIEALKSLRGCYLECGTRDQYNLLYGNRQFHDRLKKAGVEHRYEEFDDNHSGTDYRFDQSLPWLVARLQA